jgi:TIR domain
MDEQSILPGKIWEDEIRHAIKDTDAMLVFLSRNSVSRTGYINKEIYQALEVTRLQPPGRIFIIPARLEQCEVPERLAEIQYVDYFEPNGYDRLLSALQELSNWLNQKGPVVRTVLRGIG